MTSRHPKPRQVVQPLKAHLKPSVLPDILLKEVSERNSEKKKKDFPSVINALVYFLLSPWRGSAKPRPNSVGPRCCKSQAV
jgi:hypothetical protein